MDAKTFFVILFTGNLCVVVLLLAYKREDSEPALRDHIRAQLLMTLAYPFGAARLFSDFPLFPVLNSTLTVIGVYYEVKALTVLSGTEGVRIKRHLLAVMVFGLGAYLSIAVLTSNPLPRVVAVTSAFLLLMLPVTFLLIKKRDTSRIRLIIGIYLAFLMATYVFRIMDAVRLGEAFIVFGPSTGETIMLASMYVYQILGGVGILLLSKEKEDNRLVRLAFYDEATGALNHAGMLEKIGNAIERCSIENKSFCAGLLDIDNVAGLNQRFGIETGDAIIAKFSSKVLEQVGKAGLVGRAGGDELLVFIPGADNARADDLATEMVGIPAMDFVGEARYTISAGFVVFDNPAGRRIGIDSVREACAEALQDAKRNGPGSRVVINR